jgi:hypothetical protein
LNLWRKWQPIYMVVRGLGMHVIAEHETSLCHI